MPTNIEFPRPERHDESDELLAKINAVLDAIPDSDGGCLKRAEMLCEIGEVLHNRFEKERAELVELVEDPQFATHLVRDSITA